MLRTRFTLTALFLGLAACSQPRYENDKGSQEYYYRPRVYGSQTQGPASAGDATIMALIGATALAVNPSYYEESSIGGKCVVRVSETDPLGAPCGNMVMVLFDQETRKEVGRRACSPDGTFKFRVDKSRKYLIGVASERYAVPSTEEGPFVRGEELLVTLKPNAK